MIHQSHRLPVANVADEIETAADLMLLVNSPMPTLHLHLAEEDTNLGDAAFARLFEDPSY
jgi:hypothetical protein